MMDIYQVIVQLVIEKEELEIDLWNLLKSGNIKYVCEPNALMTLLEFALDYGDKELYEKAQEIINR